MKSFSLVAVASALAAVNASEDEVHQGSPALAEDLGKLLAEQGADIDWDIFSPSALGMNLAFDEMTGEELEKIVGAFKELKLISSEEATSFGSFLTDPRMRNMLNQATENWPEVMQRVLQDPEYLAFLQTFSQLDKSALATIVGIKDPLPEDLPEASEQEQ